MHTAWKTTLLLAVTAILGLFALGLDNNPRHIPSPLLHRPAPPFSASALDGGEPVHLEAHRGKWVMVNFWGSWCVSCIAEHPNLIALAQRTKDRTDFVIVGVDFRDTLEGGRRFLVTHGDPGYRHAFDPQQKIAIDWGVYGAPESYLVDPQGIIRLKQTGPVDSTWFEKRVLPLMRGAEK